MSELVLLIVVLIPVIAFCVMSYREAKNAYTPARFLQFGTGYRSGSFFATLLASNSSLSGALFLVAYYGLLYGASIFVWVFFFWFSTQLMSHYTVKWVDSIDANFIKNRGTLHEFLAKLFGGDQRIRITAARISMFSYIGLLAAEIVIGYGIIGSLFPPVTHLVGGIFLEPLAATLILLGLVAGYATLSGFRGVVKTDELQLLLIIIMMLAISWFIGSNVLFITLILAAIAGALFYFYSKLYAKREQPQFDKELSPKDGELNLSRIIRDLPKQWPSFLTFVGVVVVWYFASQEINHPIEISKVINPVGDTPIKFVVFFVIANVLFWLVWWPAAMDQWHRCAATTDSRVPQNRMMGTMGVFPVIYLGLLSLTFLFVGAEVQVQQGAEATDPLAAFLEILRANLTNGDASSLPIFILVLTGLIAAMISTVDSYLIVATQTWISDSREAKRSGRNLWEIEVQGNFGGIMREFRTAVPVLFVASGALSLMLMSFLTDVYAAIYAVFSGMLVLAGILGVGFFVKNLKVRIRLGHAAVKAMHIGMIYVILTNVIIMPLYEYTLQGKVTGDSWYADWLTWQYAVYINPVIAMFVTGGYFLISSQIVKRKQDNV